jgi:chemotaxis signal transduction protein
MSVHLGGASVHALAMWAGDRLLAVPIARAVEIMRPLTVTPLAGAPDYVLGASVIRGQLTPVVDLAALLGAVDRRPGRFVTVRAGDRQVALAASSVVGVRSLELEALPPLFENAAGGAIDAIGRVDAELVLVLGATRIVPDDVLLAVGG